MKKVFSIFIFIAILTFSLSAQETYFPNSENNYKGNNTHDFNDVSGMPKAIVKTQEMINLEQQIKILKESNDVNNREKLEELNNSLSILNGNVVKKGDYYGATYSIPNNNPPFIQNDNIGNTRIFNSDVAIRSYATFTEQIGTNAGRIWVAFASAGNSVTSDTLRFFYSDDDGIHYTGAGAVKLGGTDHFNPDDLDIEIIENTSGDKILWVVYGLRANGGTGKYFVGGLNYNITTPGMTFWALSWPGNNVNYRYYGIRLTSDNAVWQNEAYIHIICSFDSTDVNGNHVNTQKYVRCVNPYVSSTPTFSYLPGNFYWHNPSVNYTSNIYSDIAYFQNTADSVVVSFSGGTDSTKIFFAKCNGDGNQPVTGHYQAGSDVGAYKHHARLATNSNSNGYVICLFNQMISGFNNVRYFRTSNFGNFLAYTQSITFGVDGRTNYIPDIVGRRNSQAFYFAFNSGDSLHYVNVNPLGTFTHYQRMNFPASVSSSQGPKPGFRFVSGDSCYVIFSEFGPVNIWSAAGCTGPTIGIGNQNQVVKSYELKQNYPNPFNPSTSIQYSILKKGLVKIVVYDIIGKEVTTLVNETKSAGNYIVDFNASSLPSGIYFYKITSGDFSSVKKMTLIK